MTAGRLGRLALADFRERARRPAYALTLAAAVGLGYLAVPDPGTRWVIMQLGDYRGVYNSAYTGTATALAGALWLTLGGFYAVRGAIARDEATGVGRLLAATPLRGSGYLAAKFLSNAMVLGSMAGVLALTAPVMQLARGESDTIEPGQLLLPFALIALPLVAVTAAAALLFDATPPLRKGLGNVIWFFVWLAVALGGQGPGAPLGGIGVHGVVASMRADMTAHHLDLSGQEFSLGLTYVDRPLRTFVWDGFTPSMNFLATRLALVLAAAVAALLPALWFGRFDPARGGAPPQPRPGGTPAPVAAPMAPVFTGPPRTVVRPGGAFGRLLAGELRILVRGAPRWWWAVAAAITVAGLVAPLSAVPRIVLPAAWIWPVLIWSRLGTQRHEYGVESLLGAYPAPGRRTFAEWLSGLAVTALAALAPLVRFVAAADWAGVGAWAGGALFVPSLALALGTLSRTHRLFQAGYLPLWYATANGLPLLDFMGAVRANGHPAGPPAPAVAALSALLLGAVFAAGAARRGKG
ncbi:hypothetical protein B7755_042420 [Streptomyces sp. NBS 14/10]|uniref:hypothetical protein n=1 Tax=Streptomyces sp. NBS 14/10 TaxID=1945643 RepID=UPI000B7EC4F3|nr:hypothetical protein [Streptomyces sp. NBS 14/10]KAK1184184.1 hypothetical protein B7755_042420 [Streptomyces sp. NBS 14/10]